jgi:hypothetical protein
LIFKYSKLIEAVGPNFLNEADMLEPTTAPEKRPRGRPRGTRNKPREPNTGPRLGYRVNELAKAINTSRSVIKRAIRAGRIKTIFVGRCEVIPLAELKKLGLVP